MDESQRNLFSFAQIAVLAVVLIPALASAHEVYVLDNATILRDITTLSPNPLLAFYSNKFQFFFWAFVSFVTVSTVFCVSIFRIFERVFDPVLRRLKKYAAPLARVTLGVCLIASGYHGALFGPELPFVDFLGGATSLVQILLYVTGALIALGFFMRLAAIPVIIVYALGVAHWGSYMLNYANYLGELIFVFIIGGGMFSVSSRTHHLPSTLRHFVHTLEPYAFPTLRVLFGVAVIFASFYAKFLHSNLALDTISQYHLTNFFHFDPLFTVLGAFLIESLIGIFFIIGFEIRWTALFFLFWLALSLLYFGEAVWPHLILLGLNITFLFHGYDRYSLEGRFFKKRHLEPVL